MDHEISVLYITESTCDVLFLMYISHAYKCYPSNETSQSSGVKFV